MKIALRILSFLYVLYGVCFLAATPGFIAPDYDISIFPSPPKISLLPILAIIWGISLLILSLLKKVPEKFQLVGFVISLIIPLAFYTLAFFIPLFSLLYI